MTPRWRTAVLLLGAFLPISMTAVRATRAERAEPIAPATSVIEAQAATYIGMGGCTSANCHGPVKEWAQKLDGDGKPKGKQHINAANQLEARTYKAIPAYVKAVGGSADPYENQTCAACHTTPLPGGDFEGITCEKCHGPGSKYKVPHQDKKGAAAYVSLGMKDYGKSPAKWVPLCVDCHVLGTNAKHQALAAAGHPDGSNFDVVQTFRKVGNPSHWATRKYTNDEVARYVPAKPKPAAAPPPAPVTPPAAAAAPTPAPPAPATPTAAPITTPNPGPPPPTPAPGPGPGARTAATPAPAPAPVTAIVPPVPPPARPVVTPPVVTPVVAPPAAPPGTRSMPSSEPAPVTSAPLAGTPPSEPRTMSGLIASVQGRLINVLASLLRQDATVPKRVVPPEKPAVYSGPDRDLLKLQDDIISLALEVLGKKPGKGGGSQ